VIALACDLYFFRTRKTTSIAAVFLLIWYLAKAGYMCALSHVFRHVEAFSSSCLRSAVIEQRWLPGANSQQSI